MLLGYPFTVGGRTALELQGFGHYLTSSEHQREIHLYGTGNPRGWVFKLETQSRFVFHNAEKLFKKEEGRGRAESSQAAALDRDEESPVLFRLLLAAASHKP
jgi:hypothetical protein